jgi:hypothetical protein
MDESYDYMAEMTKKHTTVWSEKLKKREHLEDLDVFRNIIKINIKEKGWESVHLIRLFPDNDQWRALVSTIMWLRVS